VGTTHTHTHTYIYINIYAHTTQSSTHIHTHTHTHTYAHTMQHTHTHTHTSICMHTYTDIHTPFCMRRLYTFSFSVYFRSLSRCLSGFFFVCVCVCVVSSNEFRQISIISSSSDALFFCAIVMYARKLLVCPETRYPPFCALFFFCKVTIYAHTHHKRYETQAQVMETLKGQGWYPHTHSSPCCHAIHILIMCVVCVCACGVCVRLPSVCRFCVQLQ